MIIITFHNRYHQIPGRRPSPQNSDPFHADLSPVVVVKFGAKITSIDLQWLCFKILLYKITCRIKNGMLKNK